MGSFGYGYEEISSDPNVVSNRYIGHLGYCYEEISSDPNLVFIAQPLLTIAYPRL
jgi:hypothetical protein